MSLNHDNIIRVYDIEELYRTVFIIMEFVEGESLADMIVRLKAIPPLTATRFLSQTCAGLGYAHKKGILHLDINPSNIFVQPGDRIKILDFGVACPAGSDDRSIFDGTIHYMASEQIECEPVDQRSDIYSVGITAFEMVTGKKPYPGDDLKTVMNMHLNRDIPDPRKRVPDLPKELYGFIMKACWRDPARRYQDTARALEDLLPITGDSVTVMQDDRYPGPIEILEKEHALIRLFLDNLAIAADKLETEDRPPKEFFQKAIEFARNFTDRFHHFKEEHVMFTQLAQKKGGILDGQIESLRHQHEHGRNFINAIFNSLDGYTRGDDVHITAVLENLAAYIHLLRHHIHKENHKFFQMVEEEFSEKELQGLGDLFHKEDQKSGGET